LAAVSRASIWLVYRSQHEYDGTADRGQAENEQHNSECAAQGVSGFRMAILPAKDGQGDDAESRHDLLPLPSIDGSQEAADVIVGDQLAMGRSGVTPAGREDGHQHVSFVAQAVSESGVGKW